MTRWCDQPAIKPTGAIDMEGRAGRYSNPPGNPGLCGFQLSKKPGTRDGYERDGVIGTQDFMARKGMPFR